MLPLNSPPHPATNLPLPRCRVACAHMAAVVDGVSTASSRRDSDASSLLSSRPSGSSLAAVASAGPPITFLYKMCAGACPKSYGMQVLPLTRCACLLARPCPLPQHS